MKVCFLDIDGVLNYASYGVDKADLLGDESSLGFSFVLMPMWS